MIYVSNSRGVTYVVISNANHLSMGLKLACLIYFYLEIPKLLKLEVNCVKHLLSNELEYYVYKPYVHKCLIASNFI